MLKPSENPADYIVPLNINGLSGRMMRVPSSTKKNREILLIYGHHALLERWWSLVQNLREYGPVAMPDLPGFGGMDSFYKIGLKPNEDMYADYLASFIKLRFEKKRITIFAISYGFVIVTRMLQRHPELAGKVDLLIGYGGFMHKDDFAWSRRTRFTYRLICRLFATRPASWMQYFIVNKFIVTSLSKIIGNAKHNFIEISPEEFRANMELDVKIWRANDARTHWLTTSQFFTLDNTNKHVTLPVVHVVTDVDQYFDNTMVEHHMRMVFSDYKGYKSLLNAHTPHLIADKKDTAPMIPASLRRILSKSPKA